MALRKEDPHIYPIFYLRKGDYGDNLLVVSWLGVEELIPMMFLRLPN